MCAIVMALGNWISLLAIYALDPNFIPEKNMIYFENKIAQDSYNKMPSTIIDTFSFLSEARNK